MHQCWRVVTEKLLMPEPHQFRILPGMPMGDEGTGYFLRKKEAERIAYLDWKAGGKPEVCRLRLWMVGNKWRFKAEKGWDWCKELRAMMAEFNMSRSDFAYRRRITVDKARRLVIGLDNPPKIFKTHTKRMFTYLRKSREKARNQDSELSS